MRKKNKGADRAKRGGKLQANNKSRKQRREEVGLVNSARQAAVCSLVLESLFCIVCQLVYLILTQFDVCSVFPCCCFMLSSLLLLCVCSCLFLLFLPLLALFFGISLQAVKGAFPSLPRRLGALDRSEEWQQTIQTEFLEQSVAAHTGRNQQKRLREREKKAEIERGKRT